MVTYPELQGKVAVISGAGGNLGLAVAGQLAAAGMRLALMDRNEAALRARYTEAGISLEGALIQPVELLQRESVEAFIQTVTATFGSLYAVLNIAGGYKPQSPLHEMDEATWDFFMGLNTKTVFNLSGIAARQMIAEGNSGRIINIAARAALHGDPGNGAHAASKSATLRLTESMAAELLDRQITVNALLPSVIDTPPNRTAMPDADYSRWVAPESLAAVILFLLSDGARDISGASIPVYGKS